MFSVDEFNELFKILASEKLNGFRSKLKVINDSYAHKGTYGSSMHLQELTSAFSVYADDLIKSIISEIQKNIAPEFNSTFLKSLITNKVYLDEPRSIVSDMIRKIEKPYSKSIAESYVSNVDKIYTYKEREFILRLEHIKF